MIMRRIRVTKNYAVYAELGGGINKLYLPLDTADTVTVTVETAGSQMRLTNADVTAFDGHSR